ncbi:MAG: hypothetical protein HY303_17210 [Candidatus Wallbacteria bacterium]|nr:hypothetical protein [Candidatus Wallbacteria bacterium]
MKPRLLATLLALVLPAVLPAADAVDFRAPLHTAADRVAEAAAVLWKKAAAGVRPENPVRKRILAELQEYCCRARLLFELSASSDSKRRVYQVLGRVNTLAGFVAADLPRSAPFASAVPMAQKAQDALDEVNFYATGWFGAFQPEGRAFRFSRELADKASRMPDRIRQSMGHSGRRHALVTAFEEFAGHARAYAAALGDPLVTDAGRANRLGLLVRHSDQIDLDIVQCRASAAVRAAWNGMHDSLRMLRATEVASSR